MGSDVQTPEAPPASGKVWQEFNCPTSGGGCGGYIMVKVNMAINGIVKVICPSCKHEHGRVIENGHIKESFSSERYSGYRNDKTEQEIIPTMAAFSKEPKTTEYLTGQGRERVSVIVKDEKKDIGSFELRQSWLEKHGEPNRK